MPTPASPYRTELPRPEHPRAQFVRPDWRSLNGEWEFEVDQGDSGLERGLRDRPLAGTIVVPFAPESKRSGVERTDFLEAVWYRRTITLPPIWAGKRVLLHFQAVDHDATVWVNGVEVARHRGGFTPFTADLAGVAGPGDQATIVVRARDTRHGAQARGKQATWFANSGPYYTRTTGIWQSVWVEAVPDVYLRRPRITPDVAGSSFHLELPVSANRPGWTVRAVLSDGAGEMLRAEARADLDLAPRLVLQLPPPVSACGIRPTRTCTTFAWSCSTRPARSSTLPLSTPGSAQSRSTGTPCGSTGGGSSNGWCSTRATGRRAS